ncbi:MAG: preprotein translocase subunit YajC [Lachnospiraceae bacterium]|nr:preprotein translocase subunit YajC [Lachnospiraceae bacterium]
MSFVLFLEEAAQENNGGGWLGTVIYIGFFALLIALFYFMAIRPQKKEETRRKALLDTVAIGDSVVTTAGFYGVVIDMIEEQNIVVVEFGNNKNCRIPMKKSAIVEVEKAN